MTITNLTTRTLASGSVAWVDDDGKVIAISRKTKPVAMAENLPAPKVEKHSRLGRTKAQSDYARKVWMDLGCKATQYGYKTDRLAGFARKRAYRKIMHAAGIPTVTNGKAHG